MAKSTSHPDCVHCRFMVRHSNGEYRCRQHNMVLHTPVSLFCKMITLAAEKDADYRSWFSDAINTDSLDPNTLYTWVETPTRNKVGEQEVQIDPEAIAALTTYITWSAGSFWQILRKMRLSKRNHYRQHGYKIDDGKS